MKRAEFSDFMMKAIYVFAVIFGLAVFLNTAIRGLIVELTRHQ